MSAPEAKFFSRSSVFTVDIQIKWVRTSKWQYSITIKTKDQYASIIEACENKNNLIFVALSIPSHEQGDPIGPDGPAAVLLVLPNSRNNNRFRFNQSKELVIRVYTKYTKFIKKNIYHTIPTGSFKNTSLVFSNTPSFGIFNPSSNPLCPQ
jgi:hypothetical protein